MRALVLTVLALTILALRAHTWDEPLETDITGAAVIGHELLQGRLLYTDIWDHKAPALHVTHAAAILVTGFGQWTIYVLGTAAAIVTLLGVYAAASALAAPVAGLWAAAFWTAIQGDLWLQANQPNTEVFVNACLVWAVALLLGARADSRPGRLIAIGGLLALGSLYKQVIVAPAAAVLVAHVLLPPEGASRRRALVDVVLVASIVTVAWSGVLGYFALAGRFADFWGAVVDYNRHYVRIFGPLSRTLLEAFRPQRLFPSIMVGLVPALALAAVGVVLGLARPPRRRWGLFLALAASIPVAVGLPGGRFFPHYYQLWLPTLAIGAGGAVGLLLHLSHGRVLWGAVVGGATLFLLAVMEAPFYALPPDEWSMIKYNRIFVEERRLGHKIDRLLEPGETFYTWGNEIGLHFWARRRPPAGVWSVWPVVLGPQRHGLQARVLADLERARPELVVQARWTDGLFADVKVLDWIATHYRPVDPHPLDVFLLFVRRDGRLDRQLQRRGQQVGFGR